MLSRAYNQAALAVLEKDFKEYLSQFDLEEGLPEILEKAEMMNYFCEGVRLTVLSWSAEDNQGHAGYGFDGDADLLRWFKANGRPRRFILVGGNFGVYETVDNVSDEATVNAFKSCFKQTHSIKFAPDMFNTGTVADYLTTLERFDREADMTELFK